MKNNEFIFPVRSNGATSVTSRAGYLAYTLTWALFSFNLTLPLSGAEVKLQVTDSPKETGKGVTIDLPGLSSGEKKLEMMLVPGRGGVKPFFMGKYEVTQGQYEALMDKNPSKFKNGPDYPVETVSWDDAKEFSRLLTVGLPDKLKGQFTFRLPTDAEWSVAVGLLEESGGTPKKKVGGIKNVYPWGSQWPPPSGSGNYHPSLKMDDFDKTAPVGSFAANQFGLYDLGGNVWEWCEDWIDRDQKNRVVRGASFADYLPGPLLSSGRAAGTPDHRISPYGFRVVLVGDAAVNTFPTYAEIKAACATAPKNQPDPQVLEQRKETLRKQQAEGEAQTQRLQQGLQQRLERLNKNWDSLKVGMSIDLVDVLVGPFEPRQVNFLKTQVDIGVPVSSVLTLRDVVNAYGSLWQIELSFDGAGKLKSWQRK